MPVHDKVKYYALNKAAHTAVNIEEQTLSWQQLFQRALSIFAAIAQNPAKEQTIAVALGNDLEFAPAWLAATANKNVCAVIDPQLPTEQLRDVLNRLSPRLLLLRHSQTAIIALAKSLNIDCLPIEDVENLADEHLHTYEDAFVQDVNATTSFLINFTSGTTSTPKAFMRSRHSWRESFRNGQQIFDLSTASSTLFPGPLFHGIGLYCLNESLDAGTSFYCMQKWQASKALEIILTYQVQRLVLVPTMLTAFARLESFDAQYFSSITHLLSAGAKLEMNHYRTARRLFPHARIQEYYGASELGFIAVSTLNDENVERQLPTVGLPFPEVSWSIRDEHGRPLAQNKPGFIYLTSAQVCSGYLWGDDGNAFKTESWGSTVRDIGYINPQGQLHVIGRSGDMVISGGNNIYLSEIESVLKSLPEVIEAVVLAVDDEYLGKKAIAFFESNILETDQLPALCRSQLAKYKIPAQFCKLDHWPLTPSGKIKRSVLEKMYINHEIK